MTKGTGAAFRAFAAAGTQRYAPDVAVLGVRHTLRWVDEAAAVPADTFDALSAECGKYRFGKATVTVGPLVYVFGR